MGCNCTRENALKVITANKISDKNEVNNLNNSCSVNNIGTTKNPSSYHNANAGNNVSLSRIDKLNKDYFSINIYFQENDTKQLQISLENKQEYITLSQLLNKAIFESKDFDINFTSKYVEKEDDYEYFIQRINNCEASEDTSAFDKFLNNKRKKTNNSKSKQALLKGEEEGSDGENEANSKNIKNNNNNNDLKSNSNDEKSKLILKKKSINSKDKNIKNTNLSKIEEENLNQGFIWTLYINNTLENFSLLCQENRIIHKDEIIELKYESFPI